MFSKRERDGNYIARLREFIEKGYGLPDCRLSASERGWYGEAWIVSCADGKYFAKVIADTGHIARYRKSFAVIEHLRANGIDFISEPVQSLKGEYCLDFEDGVIGLFRFVEGVHTEEYPLEDLMALLARTYSVPTEGVDVPREYFGLEMLSEAEQSVRMLAAAQKSNPLAKDAVEAIRGCEAVFRHCAERLRAAAEVCRRDLTGFVLTSGDVGGNVIINDGRMTIIDWDDMHIAPPERDLWFYMQDMEQIRLIERSLSACGFAWCMKPERLVYYCCQRWFFYVCEYARAVLAGGVIGTAALEGLRAYLAEGNFTYACLAAADALELPQ